MIRKENKSGPWTLTCDTKNSFVSRKYGTIMEGKECMSFWYGSVLELRPGYQVFWWRAAQVQEVTGHTVQRAIWRNMRSLF